LEIHYTEVSEIGDSGFLGAISDGDSPTFYERQIVREVVRGKLDRKVEPYLGVRE